MSLVVNAIKGIVVGTVFLVLSMTFSVVGLVAVHREVAFISVPIVFTASMVVSEELGRFTSSRLMKAAPRWRWYVSAIPIMVAETLPQMGGFLEAYGPGAENALWLGALHKIIALSGHVVACVLWGYVARGGASWYVIVTVSTLTFHLINNMLVLNHVTVVSHDVNMVLQLVSGAVYIAFAYLLVSTKSRKLAARRDTHMTDRGR